MNLEDIPGNVNKINNLEDLSDDVIEIYISSIDIHDLKRFNRLKILNCPCNELPFLPLLPNTLEVL